MSLFKAFQKDRKIGKTPFSLNFQNILTANFGGLTPIAKIQVLPNDTFKVGTNVLTKVEPMPAPAFTRIKQNQYAFFVPNEQTWKHWNDFITNGTAYADTYGNNSTNQKLSNLWRIPQIPANQIQLISKIANGWAIPVFDLFKSNLPSNIWSFFFTSVQKLFTDDEIYFLANNLRYNTLQLGNLTTWFSVLFSAVQKRVSYFPDWVFNDIPFWNFVLLLDEEEMPTFPTKGSRSDLEYYIYSVVASVKTEIGADYYTASNFQKFLHSVYVETAHNKVTGTTKDLNEIVTLSAYTGFVAVRSFCDNVSNDVSERKSPFILVKKVGYKSDGTSFNYYAYNRNLYEDQTFDLNSSANTLNTFRVLNRNVRKCGYFWSSDVITYEPTDGVDSSQFYRAVFLNNFPFNPKTLSTSNMDLYRFLGVDSNSDLLSDNLLLTMLNFKSTPNEILYDVSRSTLSGIEPFTSGVNCNADSYGAYIHPFHWQTLPAGGSSDTVSYDSFSIPDYYCWDIAYPLFDDSQNISIYDCSKIPFDMESRNLGYDSWSFFVYCCKNSCKLLDYMNIPLEGLSSRSYEFYAGEFIKALPFFAYSKIWNDYFRNKVTSSAEMDYTETNSVCSIDNTALRFYSQLVSEETSDSKKFPDWFRDTCNGLNNECPNGWSLPFTCAPKNANEDFSIDAGGILSFSDINHFHDYRLYNWFYAISLLTGFQLMFSVIWQIIRVYSRSISDTSRNYFRLMGILAEKMYLPSYYNGLLHYKYQNFNKDYFSSALLDPMSGANQEDIGDTVNSLINAQARQGFWNRLAQNRSVTQFWQSVFGVKPSHDDYDKPLLLGSAHTDVNVGEVVQLSQTDTTPQGQRSGLGSAHDSSKLFKHTFNEHGYILILVSHTLELQYMQGLEKDWTPEESFLDYPFIDFVGLGNQSINQKELNFTARPKLLENTFSNSFLENGSSVGYIPYFANVDSKISYNFPSVPKFYNRRNGSTNADPVTFQLNLANGSGFDLNSVFGYIPRYSTFKFCFDQCHGEFRNQLSFWHSFRKFFTQPILCHEFVNWEFMSENDELQRMFFVTDDSTDKFKIDSFINITSIRPLPYVCTPKTSI